MNQQNLTKRRFPTLWFPEDHPRLVSTSGKQQVSRPLRLALAPSLETVGKDSVFRIRTQTACLVKVLDCLSLVLSDLPRNLYNYRDQLVASVPSVE